MQKCLYQTQRTITQSARELWWHDNVNFNINTLDASGFVILVRNRGTITQIINNAVNEEGVNLI